MANTQISWTPSVSGNRVKWTWSGWIKRSSLGEQAIFGSYQSGAYATSLRFDANDSIHFEDTYNSNTNGRIITTAKFRDTSAWYHVVAIFDNAAGSSASDKIQVWVNGVNQAGAYGNAPTNATTLNADGTKIQHGQLGAGSNFDGLMSHVHFCDGYHYDASYFGETDSTTGEWKIKTSPSVSYGTNGFWILKDGNSVSNQAGTSNPNFTVENGTLTKTEDNPSNVFAIWNPLNYNGRDNALTNGNLTSTKTGSDGWTSKQNISTLGMNSGKFYFENKITNIGTTMYVGGIISDPEERVPTSSLGYEPNAYAYYFDGRIISNGSELQTGLASMTTNDILGVAFDATNGTLQFYKNGSAIGSQVTSIPVGDRTWFFACNWNGTAAATANFGNGYFGTTAVSSAGTNASGIGIFEYDVPTGYTALSTKGLNE